MSETTNNGPPRRKRYLTEPEADALAKEALEILWPHLKRDLEDRLARSFSDFTRAEIHEAVELADNGFWPELERDARASLEAIREARGDMA